MGVWDGILNSSCTQRPGQSASVVLGLQWGIVGKNQGGTLVAGISKCEYLWGKSWWNLRGVHGSCAGYWFLLQWLKLQGLSVE